MAQVDAGDGGPARSSQANPTWWETQEEEAEIPLEALESDPLPDGTRPTDIPKLHGIIRSLARENRILKEQLAQELMHRYGKSSEKGKGKGDSPDPDGGGAENGSAKGDPVPDPSQTGETAGSDGEDSSTPGGHGRRPIPPDLQREEILIELADTRCGRCQGPTHRLERLESYRYDFKPGTIVVRVLVRWKHVCDDPTCDGPFRVAPLPPEPIPKGRATAGLLAHLLVSKFGDHCPVYRFQKILLRQKVDLAQSTLVDYCRKSTDLLRPLWELMRQRVLESTILGTDDTHVQVRIPGKKGGLKGHLWAYKGDAAHPYVVFAFTPNWSGKGPQDFLKVYKGKIQADAYKGYDQLFTDPDRIEIGCMAHARRKWVKAQRSTPGLARHALDLFGQLYAVEDEAKGMDPEARQALRQEKSAPVLAKLAVWMNEIRGQALPKSPVANAIDYATNQWRALNRYLEDGHLKIDNNDVERELRNVALGRKNWLAAGSEVGGETAAIGYTMVRSAEASGVNVVDWLTDVLEQIVTCPPERLPELLPDQWKLRRVAHVELQAAAAAASPVGEAAQYRLDIPDDVLPLEATTLVNTGRDHPARTDQLSTRHQSAGLLEQTRVRVAPTSTANVPDGPVATGPLPRPGRAPP